MDIHAKIGLVHAAAPDTGEPWCLVRCYTWACHGRAVSARSPTSLLKAFKINGQLLTQYDWRVQVINAVTSESPMIDVDYGYGACNHD